MDAMDHILELEVLIDQALLLFLAEISFAVLLFHSRTTLRLVARIRLLILFAKAGIAAYKPGLAVIVVFSVFSPPLVE
jgi:hypothetical protein